PGRRLAPLPLPGLDRLAPPAVGLGLGPGASGTGLVRRNVTGRGLGRAAPAPGRDLLRRGMAVPASRRRTVRPPALALRRRAVGQRPVERRGVRAVAPVPPWRGLAYRWQR